MFQKQCSPDSCGARKTGSVNTNEHHRTQSPSEIIDEMESLFFSDLSKEVDPDLVDSYLAQLDEIVPIEDVKDPEQSRTEFEKKHAVIMQNHFQDHPGKYAKKSHRGLKKLFIAAAIVCTLVMFATVAYANTPDSPFVQWLDEIFSFGAIRPDEYGSLQEALDDYGINNIALPTWIPPDYTLADISVSETDAYILFAAQYTGVSSPDSSLVITVKETTPQNAMVYEKNESDAMMHTSGNMTYYITNNHAMCSILWYAGDYECCISGVIKEDEISAIIDSIE